MNKSTHTIRQCTVSTGDTIKLWRQTTYQSSGLHTDFFVDVYKEGGLWLRQNYDSINEGLDHYYSLMEAATRLGYSVARSSL